MSEVRAEPARPGDHAEPQPHHARPPPEAGTPRTRFIACQTKLSPHNPRPYDINFFSSAWGLALGWLMRHLFHIFRFEMRTLCGGRSCGLNFFWCLPSSLHFWFTTGVCEINTHFDLAVFLHVLTPLPVFQSCRKDAGQQLTKMSVYFTRRLHSMCACSWTLT